MSTPAVPNPETAAPAAAAVKASSFDEWSPLREVVVGSPISYNLSSVELSFKLFFHDNAYQAFCYPKYQNAEQAANPVPQPAGAIPQKTFTLQKQYLEELNEDVAGLVSTLEKLNVKVHRPIALSEVKEFTTPYWKATNIPALNVRDQVIIIGDEIIETPPQIRARYFENDLLKPIFYRYFVAGSKWTMMPKPIMTDRSFDLSYVNELGREMIAQESVYTQGESPYDVGHEIMIDGAQFMRFGRDIIVNVSTVNHELGLKWLERHFGDKYRFHRIYRLTDNHIDSIVLPLRPGTLLLRAPKFLPLLPKALQKWDIIYPPEPSEGNFPEYSDGTLLLASKYIDLNVLSIDTERVIVNSLFPELMRKLERHGFTPIPVQHRHRRIFGGGFHCFTLDTVREGTIGDYFS